MLSHSDVRGNLYSLRSLTNTKEILVNDIHANVWKGFHLSPYCKRIYVLSGKIYDYIYNPLTGDYKSTDISAGNFVDIPAHYAHGLYTIEETKLIYLLEGTYDSTQDINIHWSDPKCPFSLDMLNFTISKKDKDAYFFDKYDYVVLGSKGFLGSEIRSILKQQGKTVLEVNDRLEDIDIIEEKIVKSRAPYVICAAGISGKPTIEWSETHEPETYRTNFVSIIDLMRITNKLSKHLTIFGSGLVYTAKNTKYSETDVPDYYDKVYCKWRIELEKQIHMFKNVLYLRMIYPISGNGNPKCFISKMLTRVNSIHKMKVSVTVVPNMFPLISAMCDKNLIGIYNFVNKGDISLIDIVNITQRSQYKAVILDNNLSRGGYELLVDKLERDTEITVSSPEQALANL
jgi:dTDP-4-dehydrorhamnose 3,5-epimerase-like enzyme/dTDP-4-dehydrorhamnose reductase